MPYVRLMKLSAVPSKDLDALSVEQVSHIVFDIPPTEDRPAVAALLLGGSPVVMDSRVRAAAELYRKGLVPLVIPTGGVRHDDGGTGPTEAEYMADVLKESGVPDDAIVLENEATTTRGNMIFGGVVLERALHPRGVFPIYIVTSEFHLRRSLAVARLYLPRTAHILGCAAVHPGGGRNEWANSEYFTNKVRTEVGLLKWLIDHCEMDDIEFPP